MHNLYPLSPRNLPRHTAKAAANAAVFHEICDLPRQNFCHGDISSNWSNTSCAVYEINCLSMLNDFDSLSVKDGVENVEKCAWAPPCLVL